MDIKNKKLFQQKCFVNGKWIKSNSKKTIPVYNPATLEQIGEVPKCSREETKEAISTFSSLIAYLSLKFNEMEKGTLKMPDASLN